MFNFIENIFKSPFVLLILLSSCNSNYDEIINPNSNKLIVENERKWNTLDFFPLIRSCYCTGEKFLIASEYDVKSLDASHTTKFYGFIQSAQWYYPAISESLCVSTLNDGSHLIFHPLIENNLENITSANSNYIKISDIDDSFGLELEINHTIGAINNQQQFLTVVNSITEPTSVLFLLFDYKIIVDKQNIYSVEIDTIRIIKDSNIEPHWQIFAIDACEDNFLISVDRNNATGKNYKIDSNGQLQIIDINSERVSKFLINENTYFCTTFGADKNIYKSENKGMNWQFQAKMLYPDQNPEMNDKIYEIVENKLIVTSYVSDGEIFSIDMATGEYKELENSGLSTYRTFITQFNENVYIATPAGLFFKKLKYFFDEKSVN